MDEPTGFGLVVLSSSRNKPCVATCAVTMCSPLMNSHFSRVDKNRFKPDNLIDCTRSTRGYDVCIRNIKYNYSGLISVLEPLLKPDGESLPAVVIASPLSEDTGGI